MTGWDNLSSSEKADAITVYVIGGDLAEYAKKANMRVRSLERKIREVRSKSAQASKSSIQSPPPAATKSQIAKVSNWEIPLMSTRKYTDAPVVETDDAIIIGDVEIPDADPWMLTAAYLLGVKHNIKTLIINGDLIATDQDGLNHWIQSWIETGDMNYDGAIGMTRKLLEQLATHFDEIHITEGNHDRRVATASKGQVHLAMLLVGLPVKVTRYEYLWLKTKRGWSYVCHPSSHFSELTIALMKKLQNAHVAPDGSKANVIISHVHQAQSGFSDDGMHELHAIGCTRDQTRTKYTEQRATKYAKWQQGIMLVERGYLKPLTRRGADWDKVFDFDPTYLDKLAAAE